MRRGGVARAAAVLAALTAVSQLLGFVRDAVIAAVFGAGAEIDAFFVAQGVMNLVLALVAGAMAKAIVPPVSRAASADDVARANRTVQTALTVTLIVLVTGSVVMYVGADLVVAVLAPGFDDATAELTSSLTRIVLFATVFVAATNIFAAAAQAHGRFFLSGFEGVPFNVVMIAAAALFGATYGVEALAVGFVIGSAIRLLVQLPAVRAAKLRLRPRLALRDPDFREVLQLAPPLLLTAAVVNVNTLVDRAVGSAQGEGVIASLSFGWRIVTLVDSLLVVTLAAALYPAFSAVGTPDKRGELRAMVGRSLSIMLVLLAPVTALLVVAAEPIVTLVFGRGDFDDTAVRLTSIAVVGYAVSAMGLGVRVVASRASFAMGDSRMPVAVAIFSMAVNVAGDLTLGVTYGVAGLAASTSLSLLLGAVLMVVLLHRRHGAVDLRALGAATARVVAAATVAAVASSIVGAVAPLPAEGTGSVASRLLLMTAVLGGVYVTVLLALRSRELRDLVTTVRQQFDPRRR